jgi:glycosyltransferase involved in cell wall biosynthesis
MCGMQMRVPESPPKIPPISDSKRPFWSVMIPAYNCIDYLEEAMTSVLNQDPGPEQMQIEVVDDYSTDGNVEALVKRVGQGRVKYFRQKSNIGSLRNFESCIKRSHGYHVHLLHGDDRVEPGYYKELADLFKRFPHAGAAFTNFAFIDVNSEDAQIVNERLRAEPGLLHDFLYQIARRQLVQPPAIVVKRSTYEALGSFYAVHFGEDWEMWTRIAAHYPIAYSPRILASYRVAHGIGISQGYFVTGQNITDILKVIDIVQSYLPQERRLTLKNAARAYYATYSVKIANSFLVYNRKAALQQVRGAWMMSKDLSTTYWIIRFYLMYMMRYKDVELQVRNARSKKLGV